MNLSEIYKMVEEDSKIDRTNLSEESLRIPELHNKYRKMLLEQALVVRRAKKKYHEIRLERMDYYKGKGEKPCAKIIVGKDNVEAHLNADRELNSFEDKLICEEEKYKYIENTIKELSNRSFQIKNAIEYLKFTNNTF